MVSNVELIPASNIECQRRPRRASQDTWLNSCSSDGGERSLLFLHAHVNILCHSSNYNTRSSPYWHIHPCLDKCPDIERPPRMELGRIA